MTNHEIWQAVLAEFELTLTKANFQTWFKNTGIGSFDSGGFTVVCVPNTFIKTWLEKKYHNTIVKLLEKTKMKRSQVTGVDFKNWGLTGMTSFCTAFCHYNEVLIDLGRTINNAM